MKRRRWFQVVVVLVAVFIGLTMNAVAVSVVISPARLEVEVEPGGSKAWLTLFNRGEQPVELRFSTGMGGHEEDGAPLYFDDPQAMKQSAALVRLGSSRVTLGPGAMRSLSLELPAVPGAVAAYPVIFAEVHPLDEKESLPSSMVRSVTRLAIPLLLTYTSTREERRPDFVVESVRVFPGEDGHDFEVDVTVRNVGNVHDWVRGRVRLIGSDGDDRGQLLLPEQRVLPGAVRTFRARASFPAEPEPLRVVAEVYGDGWRSAPFPYTWAAGAELARGGFSDGAGEETSR